MVDSKRDLGFCASTKGGGFPLFNVFKGNFKGDFKGDFRGDFRGDLTLVIKPSFKVGQTVSSFALIVKGEVVLDD